MTQPATKPGPDHDPVRPPPGPTPGAMALRQWLRSFMPAPLAVNASERWRGIAGGFIGVLFAALLSRYLLGGPSMGAWLVGPLGASAVLVFAVPASPLAQPWSVIGGNVTSGLVGLACAALIPDPLLAAAVAVALAILAMLTLRCLHPPGGAMALSAVLAHAVHGQFTAQAALLNSVLLVAAGLAYNTLTGRRYPHIQVAQKTAPMARGAQFKTEDLDEALKKYNQVLDVSRDDLEALLVGAELEGYRRRLGNIRCADVMSRDVVAVEFGSSLLEAWSLMKAHGIKALPVVDRARRIIGIVTMVDFLRGAHVDARSGLHASIRRFLLPDGLTHSDKPEVVGQIMTAHTTVVREDRLAVDLMPIFTNTGHHHIPIVNAANKVVGIVTQSDFMRFLNQSNYLEFDRARAG